MLDCTEEFSQKQLEILKRIIHTDVFREINSIVNICDLNQDEDKILDNIKTYIWDYLAKSFAKAFSKNVDYLIEFINDYQNKKETVFNEPSKDGNIINLKQNLLVVCNGYHIYHDFRSLKPYCTFGLYMRDTYLGTDHQLYFAKASMKSKELRVSPEAREEVDYNSLLAESVFHYFSQPVANYYLLDDKEFPYNAILTPNFLKKNQELIHLIDIYEYEKHLDTHTYRLELIKKNLEKRYKSKMNKNDFQKLIEKIQIQFCIQSFIKLLIGPMDINYGNTALVLTHNGTEIPDIDISPAYDLDISFNTAAELVDKDLLDQIIDKNRYPSTIKSLIEEFKDIPGFKSFLEEVIRKMSSKDIAQEVLDDVYQRTNLLLFKERKERYMLFMKKRFVEVLEAYKEVYLMEDINDISMGR